MPSALRSLPGTALAALRATAATAAALARVATLALAGVAALAASAHAEEAIERFDSTIEVRADGDLAVTETIVVHAEGAQIRRGIFRDFPLRFRDAEGRLREVGFELVEVTRDGRPEPHFTRRNDRGVRIYAGAEDVLLQPGRHAYRFSYVTSRQLRHFPDHVELYWNVTGNEWTFPIREASATVRLPGNAAPVRWTAYTGRFGERGEDFRAALQPDGALVFASTRGLRPGEGLTVVAELPAGVVAAPTQAQQIGYALLDYRRYLLAGLGVLGVLGFYLFAWRAVGRDPPKGTVIPQFHPPEGISPALAAYIRNWGWKGGWREFTAAAVSLAVKGLVVFDDRDGTLTLQRAPRGASADAAATLPAGERALLGWIDERGGTARVKRSNGESLVSALARFKTAIEKDNRNRFFRRNLGWFVAGIALTALAVAATFRFGYLDDDEIGLLIGVIAAGVFVGGFLMGTVRSLLKARSLRTIVPAAIHTAMIVFVGAVITTMLVESGVSLDGFRRTALDALAENGFPLALVGGFALLNGLFYYLLRAPTAAGRPVMDRIEGLELYLRTAESARMNMAGAPEITTAHFERLLPYAIALEAEKPWSEAFEAAFARAHPGEDLHDAYRPAWHGGTGWSSRNFASSVAGTVAAAEASFASAMPAPSSSSSGFGGGGSSGGGGGGGGGGGW
ncbi:MAG: DUF2207 domain-containing protein [Lautropia sp.]|nr:MAG: DUF2207 domain-containing protein [Pseudomonadota bacterium]MBC6960673.1 DUF2207 domain-containing protein [Lautropia sp.]MCL4702874.1 DUF2207 domain-containing protein [Burkholderiaceae bacterium]MDL1908871.1 DUF2207 domain-containing protein [Betaproteobacteria bacterium PRO1]MEB2336649.1 DUF2207 domain-containing protein [Burkholderiales bacterium]